jgi:inhibitor of KinA
VTDFRIVAAGDSTLLVEFQPRIDAMVNARVVAVAEALQREALPGVRDIVPTYRTVAVYFDPLRTDCEQLTARLERHAVEARAGGREDRPAIRIPVCYGGDFGPDLADVARFGRLTESEAVAKHCGATYRVFMLGFVPGFPYMGVVDGRIAIPRRTTPRVRVPAGSVGIAGPQTGVYPSDTPGGWQLVGRTPMKCFDAAREDPFLLKAGDAVRFYPIARDEYERWPST